VMLAAMRKLLIILNVMVKENPKWDATKLQAGLTSSTADSEGLYPRTRERRRGCASRGARAAGDCRPLRRGVRAQRAEARRRNTARRFSSVERSPVRVDPAELDRVRCRRRQPSSRGQAFSARSRRKRNNMPRRNRSLRRAGARRWTTQIEPLR
jgi:hypothetical protein